MTISYNWLSEYLPEKIDPQQLSHILTSIGLEVESLEYFESIKGGLKGVVIGEVMECQKHPNADKLRLTKVDIGAGEPLKIVCGAPNVAAGQKVLVATIGTTIYPIKGEPLTMKAAKIRGEESQGMICAEDEIGLGSSHDGILILPQDAAVGTKAADYFKPYNDWIFEIGLTPNRMDAMSHLGVARDVCAYLTYHNAKEVRVVSPFPDHFRSDNNSVAVKVSIENTNACRRYSGVTITGLSVKESPLWLRERLISIGQRPINNIVDITNYILHETGQPLHAFDMEDIAGESIIVKNLPQNEIFVTLDQKERTLDSTDLMICNEKEGMCIAGVFGGAKSGVKPGTRSIFLESAWFDPATIRKTSFRHGLRTEAAVRFEKGVDVSNVVNVLKRAALLIKDIAGGEVSSEIIDVFPYPQEKTQVNIKYQYLKKLSGKNYESAAVREILTSLGFVVIKENDDELTVAVPFSKPDITLPADIVEEVLRIDGLDNIDISGIMTIAPSTDENIAKENLKEKVSGYLTGLGFNEIVTNSITNSKYYSEQELSQTVKMINSLSADLNVMRPSMVETGLEAIAYNLNRKNKDLRFFELGKTYHSEGVGHYAEEEHLVLYMTGENEGGGWRKKETSIDFYTAKGIATAIIELCDLGKLHYVSTSNEGFSVALSGVVNNKPVVKVGQISVEKLAKFDLKQPVFFIDFNWADLLKFTTSQTIIYREVSKFPSVERDLAIVVSKNILFRDVQQMVDNLKVSKLQNIRLFDVFESEKLGEDRKSMAVNFTFMDEEKTMTDKEIDGIMNRLIKSFETVLGAEIRK